MDFRAIIQRVSRAEAMSEMQIKEGGSDNHGVNCTYMRQNESIRAFRTICGKVPDIQKEELGTVKDTYPTSIKPSSRDPS